MIMNGYGMGHLFSSKRDREISISANMVVRGDDCIVKKGNSFLPC